MLVNHITAMREAAKNPAKVALAREAIAIVSDWCNCDRLQSMNSGSDTGARMLLRIACDMTAQEAAAREYLYRWHLPLNQWVNHSEAHARSMPVTGAWPVPHCIGL